MRLSSFFGSASKSDLPAVGAYMRPSGTYAVREASERGTGGILINAYIKRQCVRHPPTFRSESRQRTELVRTPSMDNSRPSHQTGLGGRPRAQSHSPEYGPLGFKCAGQARRSGPTWPEAGRFAIGGVTGYEHKPLRRFGGEYAAENMRRPEGSENHGPDGTRVSSKAPAR